MDSFLDFEQGGWSIAIIIIAIYKNLKLINDFIGDCVIFMTIKIL